MPRKSFILLFIFAILAFMLLRIIKFGWKKELISEVIEEKYEPVKIKKIEKVSLKPPTINLNLLEKKYKNETFSIGRNIFRYSLPKKEEKLISGIQEKRGEIMVPKKPEPEPLSIKEPMETQKIEPPKPRPPDFNYKYLGFFGPKEKKLAVFTNGKDIINIFEGETIDDKFILKEIGYESVKIGFKNFPEDIIQKIEVGP